MNFFMLYTGEAICRCFMKKCPNKLLKIHKKTSESRSSFNKFSELKSLVFLKRESDTDFILRNLQDYEERLF